MSKCELRALWPSRGRSLNLGSSSRMPASLGAAGSTRGLLKGWVGGTPLKIHPDLRQMAMMKPAA